MKLIVLHAAPGVGKLTVAKELQSLTGYRLFHNHLTLDLVLSLLPMNQRPAFELRERIWLDALATAARAGVEGVIFTLVFEPTLVPGFHHRLLETIESNGGSVHLFELRCALEENARRVVQPDRRRYLKETSAEFLLGGLASGAYQPPVDLIGNVVIDTTDLPPMQTARRVLEALNPPMR